MRARMKSPSGWPAARSISTPRMLEPALYSQRLAGLRHQRQLAQAAHVLVRAVGHGGIGRAEAHQVALGDGGQDRILVRRAEDDAEPAAEGEQVLHRDRALGRDGVVERGIGRAQHAAVRQLRQQPLDRLVHREPAVLHQHQRGDRGDRLGHRGDAEDRVAAHRPLAVVVHRAERHDAGVVALPPPARRGRAWRAAATCGSRAARSASSVGSVIAHPPGVRPKDGAAHVVADSGHAPSIACSARH